MVFQATHQVGGQGAPTWATPDAAAALGPRLDPWLRVQVIQTWGAWARIRCENGWEAWTDGRMMQAAPTGYSPPAPTTYAQPAQPAQPAPVAPQPAPAPAPAYGAQAYSPQAYGYAQPAYGTPAYGVAAYPRASTGRTSGLFRVFGPIGAILAVVSTWMPWLTAGGFSVNGWDIPLWGLVTNDPSDSGGIKVALPMLVAGLGIVAALVRPPAALLGLLMLFAAGPCLLFVFRWLTEDTGAHLGIGPPAGILASLLLGVAAIDAFAARR
jgi:hypothetical protein